MTADNDLPQGVRASKLASPMLSRDVIPRPRIDAVLDDALTLPLTLVSAPAGMGKTTAISSWLQRSHVNWGWLTVDTADNRFDRFLLHFVSVLRRLFPRSLDSLLREVQQQESPFLAGELVADALVDFEEDVIVVLDDVHQIQHEHVWEFLNAILTFPPPSLHLVISTRVDPPLSINRMRARARIRDLRTQALRFDQLEVGQFLHGVSSGTIPPDLVKEVNRRTQGWPAGLRLSWFSMRDHPNSERLPDLVTRDAEEFLIQEVLSELPGPNVDLLARSAIFDEIRPESAAAVADSCERKHEGSLMIDVLDDLNPFVTRISGTEDVFRYHPILRDALLRLLDERTDRDERARMHLAASRWLADHGDIDGAVEHALKGDDSAQAVEVVERFAPVAIAEEDWVSLRSWLSRIPEEVISQHSGLVLAAGFCAEAAGDHAALSKALGELTAISGTGGEEPMRISMGLQTLAVLSDSYRLFLTPRLLPPGERCAKSLRELTSLYGSMAERLVSATSEIPSRVNSVSEYWMRDTQALWRALAMQLTGEVVAATGELRRLAKESNDDSWPASIPLFAEALVHLLDGSITEAETAAKRLQEIAQWSNRPESRSWASWILALTRFEANDLDQARSYLEEFEAVAGEAHGVALKEERFLRARMLEAEGDLSGAKHLIDRAALIQERTGDPYAPLTGSFRIGQAIREGDDERVGGWIRGNGRQPVHVRLVLLESPLLTWLEAMGLGSTAEDRHLSEAVYEAAIADASATHQTWLLIRLYQIGALLADANGKPEDALERLKCAIDLAEPRGLIRTFVNQSGVMARLLRQLQHYRGQTAYTSLLLKAVESDAAITGSGGENRSDDMLAEQLSARELEVLHLIQQRLSNKEIGERLFISPLTVKRHSISIYAKLGVSSRREAALKASALGLAPRN